MKQPERNWFACLSSHLFELNIKTSVHDSCLLTPTRNGQKCWTVIAMGDILYGSTDSQFITWFSDKMSEWFNIGKSGPNGQKCWTVIAMDDILYGSTDSQFITWFSDKMSERFNIGKSCPLTSFLRTSFKWGDGSLTMKHQGYVGKPTSQTRYGRAHGSFNNTRRQAGADEGWDARRRIG